MARPNVVLLVLDTARADAFEPYGAPPGSTPCVAEIARGGQVVEHAYAPSCWTVPSHAGMLTATLPRALGLGQAPGGTPAGVQEVMRAQEDRLLPGVLRRAGYTTLGVSCNAWVSPSSGFDTGFDDFRHVPSPRASAFSADGALGALQWLRQGLEARMDDGARAVAERIRAWLSEWDGRDPFFWLVNLNECHSPYLPPRPYNDLGPLGRVLAARDVKRYQTLEEIWWHCATRTPVPPRALARMHHLYARSIRLLDDWVARLLVLLDDHRVLDDTIVIVTSDHGENFGEGGLIGHNFSLDERLVRVPLVARGPVSLPHGRAVSLLELPLLLADAVGLDDHPWVEPVPAGAAIAQFDELAEPDDPRLVRITREWELDDEGVRMFTDPLTCATDGRRKLVRRGDRSFAYDLRRDPLERDPLGAEGVGETLRSALEDGRVWARPGEVPSGRADGDEDRDETAALEEQMRMLGYM